MRRFIILSLLLLNFSSPIFSQNKMLDEESYSRWRRVEDYNLSQNGRWVIYRYGYTDNKESSEEMKTRYYLFDNVTKKTDTLNNLSNPQFCGDGGWLQYNNNHLLRLSDRKLIKWERSSAPQFRDSDRRASYYNDKTKEFVVVNIDRGDSILYDRVLYGVTYDHSNRIICLTEDNGCVKLQYGLIGAKSRLATIFTDSTKLLKRFNYSHVTGVGSFEINSLHYSFRCEKNGCELLFDSSILGEVDNISVLENSNFISYEPKITRNQSKKDKDVIVELWAWDDLEVPSARSQGSDYKSNPPRYIYNAELKKSLMICDSSYSSIGYSNSPNSIYAYRCDDTPYLSNSDWEHDRRMDIYSINLLNGANELIIRGTTHRPQWSYKGDYILYFSSADRAWFSFNPATGQRTNISFEIGFSVYDEEYDRPNPAASYGLAAYCDNGYNILLYDKYDIWVVDIRGEKKPLCMTQGYGREHDMTIRLFNPNSDKLTVSLSEDQEVEVFNHKNMDKGFYTLTAKGRMVKNFEGAYFMKINKVSVDKKTYLYQRQSFTEDRDLWISDSKFKNNYKISDVNPQQKEYKWGRVELFQWENYDGTLNKGLLYLPDDYVNGESYPTIVSFYETHTSKRHIFYVPSYSSAMIDIPTYVSRGYIVFQPDVHFTIGEPGQSSFNAVVSGVNALINSGVVDAKRVGLQGHSWSGYQVSYLVTKTDLFACVNIGAAVVNMTSSYVGIRDGSGMPRMFMYEDWQCRMGKTLWEDKSGYIENSPIMEAEKINTPALIFHCDNDEAVSYSEGRSLFLALRRLRKPAWMMNYKGEGHFLSSKAARIDWSRRMEQFYDYYLKNGVKPNWM